MCWMAEYRVTKLCASGMSAFPARLLSKRVSAVDPVAATGRTGAFPLPPVTGVSAMKGPVVRRTRLRSLKEPTFPEPNAGDFQPADKFTGHRQRSRLDGIRNVLEPVRDQHRK